MSFSVLLEFQHDSSDGVLIPLLESIDSQKESKEISTYSIIIFEGITKYFPCTFYICKTIGVTCVNLMCKTDPGFTHVNGQFYIPPGSVKIYTCKTSFTL